LINSVNSNSGDSALNRLDVRKLARRGGDKFPFDFNLIPPVQSSSQKYFCSLLTQITSTSTAVPPSPEGRIAIVTDVGRDAVDARSALTKALIVADGEAVWS
jgi:hypothetical protein